MPVRYDLARHFNVSTERALFMCSLERRERAREVIKWLSLKSLYLENSQGNDWEHANKSEQLLFNLS